MQRPFSHSESTRNTRAAGRLVVLGALSALLLAGCGGGTSTQSTVGNAPGGAPAQDSAGAKNSAPGAVSAPDASGRTSAVPKTSEVSKPGAPAPGVGPKLTKSASLSVKVKNVDAAAAQVRAIATGLQAQVLNEQIGTGGSGDPGPVPLQDGRSGAATGFGTLTLSVPADKLDAALDQLSKIGTVLQRNLTTQDVTAQYVDTASRVKTMRASVDRVRALMVQAKDLGQVVALESELSRRQADLESQESQLAALTNSVERSTVSVSLSTPGKEPVTQAGFGAGLSSGWDAFTASARGLFTALGAVLPFALFFALVAAPIIWWWRGRRANRALAGPASP
jgi:ABC-type Fe3+-hydroxamate transport system substrate-binding protein